MTALGLDTPTAAATASSAAWTEYLQEGQKLLSLFGTITEPVVEPSMDALLYWIENGPRRIYQFMLGPDHAQFLLGFNESNFRKMTYSLWQGYRVQMEKGTWVDNGQTIGFYFNSEDALQLTNGQHRLRALSVMPPDYRVLVSIARNAPPEGVDMGRKRTPGDVFRREGFSYAVLASAATRWVINWEAGSPGKARHSHIHHEDLVVRAKEDRERLTWACANTTRAKRLLSRRIEPSVVASFLFLAGGVSPRTAQLFADVLSNACTLPPTHPFARLREWIVCIEISHTKTKPSSYHAFWLLVRAWNNALSGRRARTTNKAAMPREDAAFPSMATSVAPRARDLLWRELLGASYGDNDTTGPHHFMAYSEMQVLAEQDALQPPLAKL